MQSASAISQCKPFFFCIAFSKLLTRLGTFKNLVDQNGVHSKIHKGAHSKIILGTIQLLNNQKGWVNGVGQMIKIII